MKTKQDFFEITEIYVKDSLNLKFLQIFLGLKLKNTHEEDQIEFE